MRKFALALCFLAVCSTAVSKNRSYDLQSPEGIISVRVAVGENITWSVFSGPECVILPSRIQLCLTDGTVLGKASKVSKTKLSKHKDYIEASVYKQSLVNDIYNSLTLSFKGFDLEFRAYDEGAAYRIVPKLKNAFCVKDETVEFIFPSSDSRAWIPYVNADINNQFSSSFESQYSVSSLSDWKAGRLAFLPVLLESNGKKVLVR